MRSSFADAVFADQLDVAPSPVGWLGNVPLLAELNPLGAEQPPVGAVQNCTFIERTAVDVGKAAVVSV